MKKLITAVVLLTLLSIPILLPIIPVQAATKSVDKQIATGNDDCEVGANNHWSLTGIGSSTGYYSPTYYSLETGLRFQSVAIPQGATITTAYLRFTCQATTSGRTVKAIIRGEDTNDAKEFSSPANYQIRSRTTAKVYWNNIEPWTKDTEYRSPEIKTIIQEIVNRTSWSSGNDIAVFWGDTGDSSSHTDGCYRAQYTHEGSPTQSTWLHVEYSYTNGSSDEIDTLVEGLNKLVENLDTQVEALVHQFNALGAFTAELKSSTLVLSDNLASLKGKLDTIEDELDTIKPAIEKRLNTIESKLSTLETREEASQRLLALEESLTELKVKSATTVLDWISLIILIFLGLVVLSRVRHKIHLRRR